MIALLAAIAIGGTGAPADLIVIGVIRPGPEATQAIVIRDGLIADVVPTLSDAPVGPDTKVLRALTVTAGWVDAHQHPDGLASAHAEHDVSALPTYATTLRDVGVAAQQRPDGAWLVGRGWDQNRWVDTPVGGWPLAKDLDQVSNGHPIVLRRVDGHALWLNTAALRAAGVTRRTPDPDGGRVIRDRQGRPTGVLVDRAMSLVTLPEPTRADALGALRDALSALTTTGLTGVHAMAVTDDDVARYEALAHDNALPLRVWAYVNPETDAAARLLSRGPWATGRFRVVGIKAFADGSLGSRGAHLSADYTDAPGQRGTAVTSPKDLSALITHATAADIPVAVHAIGDQAVHDALDAFAHAHAAAPGHHTRDRVEHSQVVAPDDRARFASLGVVASMQPIHATSDMAWAPDRLGQDRLSWAYAWRSLASAGATLAFGSDAPVEDPAPALTLWAATRRRRLDGTPVGGWRPEEALSEDEAIRAATQGAARAVNEEGHLGEVRPGNLADLTLWLPNRDRPWQPMGTIVGGEVVWTYPEPAPTP